MNASDGVGIPPPPSSRPRRLLEDDVHGAVVAACESLAVAEDAEQVQRVLGALACALLPSSAETEAPSTSGLTSTSTDDDARPSPPPPSSKKKSSKAEEACAAAERAASALAECILDRGEEEQGEKEKEKTTTTAAAAAAAAAKKRERALSSAFPALAEALLSLVAPDWLGGEEGEDSNIRSLFDAFFDGAGAAEALRACCDHLSSVLPTTSTVNSPFDVVIAFAPGAREAASVLSRRFVKGHGVKELLLSEEFLGQRGSKNKNDDDDEDDAATAAAERAAASLASCPDRAAAAGCSELLEESSAAASFARQAVEAVAAATAAAAAERTTTSTSTPSSSPSSAVDAVALAASLLLTRLARRGMGVAAAFGAYEGAEEAAGKAEGGPPPFLQPPLGAVLSRVEDSSAAGSVLRGLLLRCSSFESSSPSSSSKRERAERAASSLVRLVGTSALRSAAASFALCDKFFASSSSSPSSFSPSSSSSSTLPPAAAAVVAPLLASLPASLSCPSDEETERGGERADFVLRSSLLPAALADAARRWSSPGAAMGAPPHVAGYASAQLVAALDVVRDALKEEEEDKDARKNDPTALLDAIAPGLVASLLSGVGSRLDSPLESHRAQAMRVGGALASVLGVGGGGNEGESDNDDGGGPFALFRGCGDLALSAEEWWSSDCKADSWRLLLGDKNAVEKKGEKEKTDDDEGKRRRDLKESPLADSDDEFVAPRSLARETPRDVSDWKAEAAAAAAAKKKRAQINGKALLEAPAAREASSRRSPFAFPSTPSPSPSSEGTSSRRFDLAPPRPPRDPEALDLISPTAEGAPTAAQRAAGVAAGLDPPGRGRPAQLRDVSAALRKADEDPGGAVAAVAAARKLLRSRPAELRASAAELAGALLQARLPEWADDEGIGVDDDDEREGRRTGTSPSTASMLRVAAPSSSVPSFSLPATTARAQALVDLVSLEPEAAGSKLCELALRSPHLDTSQRLLSLDALAGAARALSAGGTASTERGLPAPAPAASRAAMLSPSPASDGATTTATNDRTRVWGSTVARRRDAPPLPIPKKKKNLFLPHAVPWATALLEDCDVERHGVDLFGRDALLLGRLMTTLASFVSSAAAVPGGGGGAASIASSADAAAPLAAALLELASSPDVRRSTSPYVRRCALASAASAAAALPPTALLLSSDDDGAVVASSSLTSAAPARQPWDQRLRSALDAASAHASTAAATDADPSVRVLAQAARRSYSSLAARTLELRLRRELGVSGRGTGGATVMGLPSEGPSELGFTRIRLPPSSRLD